MLLSFVMHGDTITRGRNSLTFGDHMKNITNITRLVTLITLAAVHVPATHAILTRAQRVVAKTHMLTPTITRPATRHFSEIPPIHTAIATSDLPMLRQVIKDNPAAVHQRFPGILSEKKGRGYAAFEGPSEPVWYQSYPSYARHMPITHAAYNDDYNQVLALLVRGAKVVESRNISGSTVACSPALIEATKHGNILMVELLIRHGAITKNGYSEYLPPHMLAEFQSGLYAHLAELLRKSAQKTS